MSQSDYTIKSVLAPISLDAFFEQSWEKKPLHISRSDSNHFAGLLSVTDLESLLSTQQLKFPQVQLTQSGKTIAAREYTDAGDQIMPLRLVEHHNDGATIVISQANTLIPSLSQLCRHVQMALHLGCQTNVYLSAPGNQGFNSHYDTHDVFVLQVSGSKTFNFYRSGVDLPFVHDEYDPELNTGREIVQSITLSAGDSLYIPRGIVHDAIASDEQTSLHITLGVFALVTHDLLKEIVQIAAEKDVAYRQSIPRSLWIDGNAGSSCRAIKQMLADAFSEENVQIGLSRLLDNVALSGTQHCYGLLSGNSQQYSVQIDSVLSVEHDAILTITRADSTVFLRVLGCVLEFTEPLGSAVEWIQTQSRFCVRDLPALNSQQKIALADRLLRENIVVPCK